MPEVGQTYSPDNAYERQAQQYRSQVGDNPEAIRQAAAQNATQSDSQLQESVQGQQGAVSAMQQLADYDKQLAGQVNTANQQQAATDATRRATTTQMGAIDPNNAAATIASGPATFDTAQFSQQYGPQQNAILSPFVASGLTSGQQQAAQGTFDLASQLRGSRERAIGTEAEAIARIAGAQIERDRLEAERKRQEALDQYEAAKNYAVIYGGEVVNPLTGQKEVYKSETDRIKEEIAIKNEAERAAKGAGGVDLSQVSGNGYVTLPEEQKQLIRQNAMSTLGNMGGAISEALKNGTTSIADILRQNPGFSPAQKLAVAEISSTYWGGFKENDDQLRSIGYNPDDLRQRGLIAGQAGGKDGGYAAQLRLSGRGDLLEGVPAGQQEDYAKALLGSGNLPAQTQKQPELSESDKRYYRDQNAAKEEAATFLNGLDKLEGLTKELGVLNVFNSNDPRIGQFNSLRDTLTRQVARLFEKGVLTDKDVEFYSKQIPSSFIGPQGQKEGKLTTIRGAVASGLSKTGLNPEQVKKEWAIAEDLRTNAGDEINSYRTQLQPGEELFYDTNTGTYQAVAPTEAPLPGFVRI